MEAAERIGSVLLGKYRVTGLLGEGGMGHVFAAEDLRLGREVAIKVLHNRAEVQSRRLRREAQVIAAVTHPNLVTLLEYDVLADGCPCLVMERVRGDSLRVLLSNHRFSVSEIFEFLRQTLSALDACHREGIVHRDLKPENVLMIRRSSGFTTKIIDFGLTKLLGEDQSVLTLQGEVFGSPRFMAPEQWFRHPVDGRTDLYALALIGFCMVLGDHFIPVGNPVAICTQHVHAARPPLGTSTRGEPIPLRLAAALHRAAEPGIDARFPNARAMLQALEGEAVVPEVAEAPAAKVALAETADLPVSLVETAFNAQVLLADDSLFEDDATAVHDRFSTPATLPDEPSGPALDGAGGVHEPVPPAAPTTPAGIPPPFDGLDAQPTLESAPVILDPSHPRFGHDVILAINRSKIDLVRASAEIGQVPPEPVTIPPPTKRAAGPRPSVPSGPPTVESPAPEWAPTLEQSPPPARRPASIYALVVGLAALVCAALWLF